MPSDITIRQADGPESIVREKREIYCEQTDRSAVVEVFRESKGGYSNIRTTGRYIVKWTVAPRGFRWKKPYRKAFKSEDPARAFAAKKWETIVAWCERRKP